jgi:hypothetical protein
VSLLNVAAVFSTVYSSGPIADDINNDAIVPAPADAISDFKLLLMPSLILTAFLLLLASILC